MDAPLKDQQDYTHLALTPEARDKLQGLVERVNRIAIGIGILESVTEASIAQYGLLLIDMLVSTYEKAQRGEIALQIKKKERMRLIFKDLSCPKERTEFNKFYVEQQKMF